MALNFQPFFLIILTLCIASLFSDASVVVGGGKGQHVVGGWQAIADINDPTVQVIGKFAVTEHNKVAHTRLKYEAVIKGETQVVAGINYRLVIAAKDGDVSKKYQAIVYVRAWENFRNLTSFKQIERS